MTNSPVTPVFLKGGIPEATNLVVDLRENHGIFCSMVVYPVIPKGEIILRIIPTAVHALEDVKVTIEAFKAVREKPRKRLLCFAAHSGPRRRGLQGTLVSGREFSLRLSYQDNPGFCGAGVVSLK